jgi:uncharacterized protein (DUF927 family)
MKNAENQQPQSLEASKIPDSLMKELARIDDKHRQDLKGSAIDDSLIALNFKSLDGEPTEDGSDVADHLLYSDAITRKNSGGVTNKHLPYLNFGAGWWCGGGVDLETFEIMPEWGCFKPDKPQPAWKKDDEGNWVKDETKAVKYHNPPLDPVKYFALRVTFAIGAKIAQRYGLSEAYSEHQGSSNQSDEDKGFWRWAISQKSIPLMVTEGAKKAACLLSHGYLSIALSGVWNACDSGKDTLKPGIAAAATGREVIIAFDSDSKEKTQKNVNRAAVKLSKGCITAGSTKVTQLEWQGLWGKGVDDLIFKKGIGIFDDSMEDRAEVKELPKTGLQNTHEGSPCPACRDISGKCTTGLSRTKDKVKVEDGVLCAVTLGKDNVPDGWEFKGLSKNGLGKLHPATPKKERPEKRESLFSSSIEKGLILLDLGDDGNPKHDADGNVLGRKVGNHLEAVAYIDSPEQDSAALLLEFGTARGFTRRWTMPRSELAGDGSEICRGLLSRGYWFDRSLKRHLLEYLQGLGSNVEKTYTVTESSGWVSKSFVLPHKTYGDENLKFRDVELSPESLTEVAGTLQEWIDRVAAMCAGNSRLILALGASFAAPLMPLLNIESGGFHLVGATSQGKTTILSVAASVIGLKDIPHWRTTTNGLESTATAFNHLCLPLDEIGQADPKDVGSIAYMLANGQGKARMKKDLTNRKGKTWQLMVLSSGEVGLGDYMAQAKVTQKGGQEVRLPDIPAVPDGSAYGCFETIHGAADAVQFVNAIEAVVKANHGAVMDAYLSQLVVDTVDPGFVGNLSKQTYLVAKQLSEGYKDSAIGRAAKRFALVQVALGLAHKYGLLPFSADQIGWAIEKVFMSWVNERGGDGSIEIKQALKKIDHLLTTNEFSKRIYDLRGTGNQDVENLLAYRKVDDAGETLEFWVPTPVFDKEFCTGVNKDELVKALQATGRMIPPRPDGKPIHQRAKKGKTQYFYIFQNIEKAGEGSEGSEGNSYNQDNNRVLPFQGRLHQHPVNSEGCEGKTDILHNLHQPLTSSEGRIEDCNPCPETVIDKASQPSQPSLEKTHIPIKTEKINLSDSEPRSEI